jgi:hypothetical protein
MMLFRRILSHIIIDMVQPKNQPDYARLMLHLSIAHRFGVKFCPVKQLKYSAFPLDFGLLTGYTHLVG